MTEIYCTLSKKSYNFKQVFNSFSEMKLQYPNCNCLHSQVFDGYGENTRLINIYSVNKQSQTLIGWAMK